jgi:hypothetical protein
MSSIDSRPTAPFLVFYRSGSGEGGFRCRRCKEVRHGSFERVADVFALATQHLLVCRADRRDRVVEGTALLDGQTHTVLLRDGVMVLSLEPVFAGGQGALRVIA